MTNPDSPEYSNAELKSFTATTEQVTTRGDGTLEKGEEFDKFDIDFSSALEHLKIHHDGDVAGSQFNSEVLPSSEQVEAMIKKLLPDVLTYDQYGRAELVLDVSHEGDTPLGWSGVKSVEEIKRNFPDAVIEKKLRMPGGVEAVEDGIEGAWYPEMDRNPETGQYEVVKDESGEVKNPKGKFEPKANIATVDAEKFREVAKTDKITVIIEKDKETGKPTVLTVYPGDNAPMFPVKFDTEDFKLDTLKDSNEERYWDEHAFIQVENK